MKKKLMICLLASGMSMFIADKTFAQDSTTTAGQDIKSAAKKTGKAVEKTAKKVGNKTAQIASNGEAAVTDKIYQGKTGPDGQRIYIDKYSKYYWIDKKGHHQPIEASELKDKED